MTISDNQATMLAALAEVWALSPDVRLGQLMAHLGFLGEAHLDRGLGYIDDDELMAILCRHRAELLARLPGATSGPPPLPGAAVSISGAGMLLQPPASDVKA